jgi:hypothetical protein
MGIQLNRCFKTRCGVSRVYFDLALIHGFAVGLDNTRGNVGEYDSQCVHHADVCVLDSELRNVVVDHYIGYGNVHDACYVLMILYYRQVLFKFNFTII